MRRNSSSFIRLYTYNARALFDQIHIAELLMPGGKDQSCSTLPTSNYIETKIDMRYCGGMEPGSRGTCRSGTRSAEFYVGAIK